MMHSDVNLFGCILLASHLTLWMHKLIFFIKFEFQPLFFQEFFFLYLLFFWDFHIYWYAWCSTKGSVHLCLLSALQIELFLLHYFQFHWFFHFKPAIVPSSEFLFQLLYFSTPEFFFFIISPSRWSLFIHCCHTFL